MYRLNRPRVCWWNKARIRETLHSLTASVCTSTCESYHRGFSTSALKRFKGLKSLKVCVKHSRFISKFVCADIVKKNQGLKKVLPVVF